MNDRGNPFGSLAVLIAFAIIALCALCGVYTLARYWHTLAP